MRPKMLLMNFIKLLFKKHNKKFISGFLVLLVIFVIFSIGKSLKINNFECKGQFGDCRVEIIDGLNKFSGHNFVIAKKNAGDYLDNQVSIKAHNVRFKFPDTLVVNVVELTPAFGLKSSASDLIALVSKSGIVLSHEDNTNVPVVIIDTDLPQIGQTVNEEQLFALSLVYDVYSSFRIKNSHISKDSLEFEYEDGIKVIAPLSGDREVLVGSLNLIKSQLNSIVQDSRIESERNISEIDLRYKNPILR